MEGHLDSLSIDNRLFDAARNGDVGTLTSLLDTYPEKLHARAEPYDWTLLHLAARHLAAVELLLDRGLDVNARERGDNTYAMHWAAAAGELEVVRRLADAGGDVIGEGDDHELTVIGWATCWADCGDAAHRAVADFLVSRGARHHIFSAIAMDLEEEVRRIVRDDPAALGRRQSRNEDHRTPLHFAVAQNRPRMVELLVALGADPLAVDGSGRPVAAYASTAQIDRAVMERIHAMVAAELTSADRGRRPPRVAPIDLVAVLTVGDLDMADRLVRERSDAIAPSGGALHLMAQRNDVDAAKWLLARGAEVNGSWNSDGVELTPLHLAAKAGHADMVGALLDAGADPAVHDSVHDSDAVGWAMYFQRPEIVRILEDYRARQ